MDNTMMVILIVGIVAAVMAGVCLLFPMLIRKGLNVNGTLEGTSNVLDTAGLVVDGLTGIFPESAALTVVDKIIDYAKQAVKAAEQMYKAAMIQADERKDKAREIIYECLKVAQIEVTPDVEKVVDGLIEAAAFALPKTGVKEPEAPEPAAEAQTEQEG